MESLHIKIQYYILLLMKILNENKEEEPDEHLPISETYEVYENQQQQQPLQTYNANKVKRQTALTKLTGLFPLNSFTSLPR